MSAAGIVTDVRRNFADDLPAWPAVDFAAFGEVDVKPLPRMRKVAAGFLARNWAMIPHVTHHDDADITALEAARARSNAAHAGGEAHACCRFSPLRSRACLGELPQFNASLDLSAGNVIYKKYCHIGIAVDTPNGLLVPRGTRLRQAWTEGRCGGHRHAFGKGAHQGSATGRHVRRLLHDQLAGWHRRNLFHAHHQRAGGGHPRRLPRALGAGARRKATRSTGA